MEQLHADRKLHIGNDAFIELARGGSDPESLELLWRLHLSRTTLFLLKVFADRPDLADVLELIEASRTADPDDVAELLAYPWVGVWARRAAADTAAVDVGYARALGLAAAVRAGLPASVTVAPVAGTVVIPATGVITRAGSAARVLSAADLSGPDWAPLRTIGSSARGSGVRLSIDDIDPYRRLLGTRVGREIEHR